MKVVCDREKLREGLAIANSVIPSKSIKPVLENVYLVASDDGLELAGTDTEVSVRYRITKDVEIVEPGAAVVPARVTSDFVRDLTGERVQIDLREKHCVIQSGTDRCELVTVDPDEFPVVPRFGDEASFSIQAGNFVRLVGQTAFAAAREAGRYAMHGILTEVSNGALRLVGTDGRRLALASMPIDHPEPPPPSVIVPTKGMQLFCRVLNDPLDQVQFQFADNQVGMRTHNAEVFARLLDGEFPRYAAVIPPTASHAFEASAELLAKKIRLVANVAGDEVRAVRFRFTSGRLDLFGHSTGRGEAHAQMEIDQHGADAEIAFNPEYVLDGLKNRERDTVRLEFEEKISPGKFLLGENYVYIVMPVTVEA